MERGQSDDITSVYASLVRQSGLRAIERLKQRRGSAIPMDFLIVLYCMYFLDTEDLPRASYLHQARRVITESTLRVTHESFFHIVAPHTLIEALVAETSSEAMDATLKEIQEFIDAREAVREWIMSGEEEYYNEGFGDDEDDYEEDAWGGSGRTAAKKRDRASKLMDTGATGGGGRKAIPASFTRLAAASIVWRSGRFWDLCTGYADSLSLVAAKASVYTIQSVYERELLHTLKQLVLAKPKSEAAVSKEEEGEEVEKEGKLAGIQSGSGAKKEEDHNRDEGAANAATGMGSVFGVDSGFAHPFNPSALLEENQKRTAADELAFPQGDEDDELTEKNIEERKKNAAAKRTSIVGVDEEEEENESDALMSEVATDLLALAHCPPNTEAGPVNSAFYEMVHSRINVIVSRKRLVHFAKRNVIAPSALSVEQNALKEHKEKEQQMRTSRRAHVEGVNVSAEDIGVPADFVPNEEYLSSFMDKNDIALEADEEVCKDEIADYYKTPEQRRFNNKSKSATPALIKPHRFVSVKTGYSWSQYNRTHYDSRTNPPPRSILWYKFTLSYPALADTRQDMSRVYRIENTENGPGDDYCILVFSVGSPYQDVAYRIPRRQWDPRPGGVRASFDANGTYTLFFRFTNSNYRR